MEPNDISALVLSEAGREAVRVPDAPRLSAATAAPLREIGAIDELGVTRALHVPIERPLTLTVDGRALVTLMTLGAAPEWLVLGYLRNQRLIDRVAAVQSIEVDWTQSVAQVRLRPGPVAGSANAGAQRLGPGIPLACALGTVFGDLMRRSEAGAAMTSAAAAPAATATPATAIAAIAAPAAGAAGAARPGVGAPMQGPRITQAQLFAILESMRRHDAIHRAAGSVHSCALFRGGELWMAVEDVSRHNGIDTVCGFMALHGVPGADKILFTTGRLTGEMVMKAAHNGIAVMISRNGTTSMGFELAESLGMTLIGRAANRRYLCYLGAERIAAEVS